MQTSVGRPVAPPARKPNSNGGPKSGKKKKTFEKKATNGKEQAAGPRPVAPAPASGPWGKPKPAITSSVPPGFASAAVPASAPPAQPTIGFSDAHQRLLRHRALFSFRFLVGKAVEVQLVDSHARYAGVLDCVDPDDFSVVLKSAKRLTEAAEPFEAGSTVVFRRAQLAQLSADGVVDYNDVSLAAATTSSGGFRTDTEISGRQGEHLFGRELQTASSWLDPSLDTGELEDPQASRRHGKKGGWNQFEANEKLFGVVSSYDENMYTTKLDKSKISTEQSRAAERLAQEIERQASAGNFHLQEERGQRGGKHQNHHDLDEEARYSSVDRQTAPGSSTYVPPALRGTQRSTNGGKAKPAVKEPVANAAEAPASVAEPPPAPSTAASTTSKPLSFSDAVLGRSAAAAPDSTTATESETVAKPTEAKKTAVSPQKATTTAAVNGSSVKSETVAVAASSGKTKAAGTAEKKSKERKTEAKTSGKPASKLSPPKKGLNPNAKEFKLSASAPEFTPSFAMPAAAKDHSASPYRGGLQGQMPPPGAPGGYPAAPDEWMYDGGGMEDGEMGMPPHYMQGGYGMPMAPMYAPMMPQQNMRMMGGQRPHGGGYGGYQQQPYHPRGYYPPAGGYPGAGMPYPAGAMPGGVGPQPPLPREPTPGDEAPATNGESTESTAPAPPTPEAAAKVGSAPAAPPSASASSNASSNANSSKQPSTAGSSKKKK